MQRYPEIGRNLEISKLLGPDETKDILKVADEFLESWNAENRASDAEEA